ncbi:SgcJ/EcaC family oxidoreductase [Nocardia paucivorans]|uniref:SgcJ/EcaC family oxidoreductase n=1 Tax=Nocardia paucivorans TaxID=114259 RepID=UPI0002ED3BF5|nr:SgcJ/EcaC family oxidoreductase [Nocardia paucivorans]
MRYEPADTAAELKAIHDVIAAVEHTQRHELVGDFVNLFRADAIWTTAHGKRLFGRDAIAEFTAKVLPGAMSPDALPRYEVEHVLFIRPDVAAVKVRQRYVDVTGATVGAEGSPLYVMAKEDGRWLLTANQNTQVVAD